MKIATGETRGTQPQNDARALEGRGERVLRLSPGARLAPKPMRASRERLPCTKLFLWHLKHPTQQSPKE